MWKFLMRYYHFQIENHKKCLSLAYMLFFTHFLLDFIIVSTNYDFIIHGYFMFQYHPQNMVNVKSAYEPSDPSGRNLSRFPQHEVTESIQSIAGLPPSIKFAGAHLYTWVERGTVRVKCPNQSLNPDHSIRRRTH